MLRHIFFFRIGVLLAFFSATPFLATAQNNRPFYYYYDEKISLLAQPQQMVVVFENEPAEEAAKVAQAVDGLILKDIMAPIHAAVFETSINFNTLQERLQTNPMVRNVLPVYQTAQGEVWIAADQIILQAKSLADQAAVERLCDNVGLVLKEKLPFGPKVPPFLVYQSPRFQNPLTLANLIQEKRLTLFAQADFTFRAQSDYVPNDNLFNQQTFLNRLDDVDIDATEAWDITQGNPNLVVAVIDGNGYDLRHVDMTGKFINPYDAVNDDNDPSATGTSDNHGTPCAGLIGAATNNGTGVAGVAFNVKVMPVIIGFNLNGGSFSTNNTIVGRAASKIAGTAGVVAVSNSWSTSSNDAAREQIYTQMRQNSRGGLGAVILGSSGNDNGNLLRYPGNFAGVINVGASDQSDKRVNTEAWGSNYSASVDVVAPGLNTYTIDRTGTAGYSASAYGNFSGTSAACPIAAGIVGLMASVNPSLTESEMADMLQLTTEKVGGYNYATLLPARPLGTWHFEMGYGRVNAFEAVKAASAPKTTISDVTADGAKISWTPIAGALNYTLRFRAVGSADWMLLNDSTDSYLIKALMGGTVYECQVAANFNGGRQGYFSILKSFTTPGDQVLSLTAAQTDVPSSAFNLPIMVNANVSWVATEDQSWVTLSPANGTADATLVAQISPNLTTNPRTAVITVTGGNITKTLNFTQAALVTPILTVSPLSVSLPPRADTFSLNISANVSWSGVDNQTWLTVPLAAGTGNGKLRLQFTANAGVGTRTATLTVNGGGLTRNITVTQAAPSLTLAPTTLNVPASAGSSNLTVTGNVVWTATDNQSWVTLAPVAGTGNGMVTVNYAANPSALTRTAVITLSGNGLIRAISLTQAGAVFTDCTDDAEPANNSFSNAPLITFNKDKFSKLGTAGDVDHWRFSVGSNTAVILRLSGLVSDFDLALLNASGAVLGLSELANTQDELVELALTTGVYYVRVSGKNNSFSTDACYRLKISSTALGLCLNAGEPDNNSLATAPLVPFNSYRFSQIANATDVDYWKFETPASGNIHLDLFNQNQDYGLELLNVTGTVLASSNKNGAEREFLNFQAPAGSYYARVFGINGASGLRCYALEISTGNWLNFASHIVEDRVSTTVFSDEISVFPNPTDDRFTLQIPQGQAFETMLTDAYGHLIEQKILFESTDFDVSRQAAGIYYLQVKNQNVQKTMKIVVGR